MGKRRLMRFPPTAAGPGGRHYWENWQAWQTPQNTNLVRIGKVSFFDLGVSRKSPVPWHFLAVLRPVRLAGWGGALCHLSSNAIVMPRGLVKLAAGRQYAVAIWVKQRDQKAANVTA